MKVRNRLRANSPCLDVGQSSLKLLLGRQGIELPIERTPTGSITEASRAQLARDVRGFLGLRPHSHRPALCALPARGVSIRCLTLPEASRDDTQRMLELQLEAELPLPLEELAWGYSLEGNARSAAPAVHAATQPGPSTTQEALVVALRRDVIAEYASLLEECGLRPRFFVGVLAGSELCSKELPSYAFLDVGRTNSEFVYVEDRLPRSVRTIPWGVDCVAASGEDLQTEAEALLHHLRAVWPQLESTNGLGPARLFLAGGGARQADLTSILSRGLGANATVQPLQVPAGPGYSEVTVALAKQAQAPAITLPEIVAGRQTLALTGQVGQTSVIRWAIGAAVLAVVALFLHYGVPLLQLSGLKERQAAVEAKLDSMPNVDRELSFLEHLEESQPPYLEALTMITHLAPQGTMLTAVSINRSGTISVQGKIKTRQQGNELRRKLAASSWFSNVALQDLSPVGGKSKLWKFQLRVALDPSNKDRALPDPPPVKAAKPGGQPPRGAPTAPPSPQGAPGIQPAPSVKDAAKGALEKTPEKTPEKPPATPPPSPKTGKPIQIPMPSGAPSTLNIENIENIGNIKVLDSVPPEELEKLKVMIESQPRS